MLNGVRLCDVCRGVLELVMTFPLTEVATVFGVDICDTRWISDSSNILVSCYPRLTKKGSIRFGRWISLGFRRCIRNKDSVLTD